MCRRCHTRGRARPRALAPNAPSGSRGRRLDRLARLVECNLRHGAPDLLRGSRRRLRRCVRGIPCTVAGSISSAPIRYWRREPGFRRLPKKYLAQGTRNVCGITGSSTYPGCWNCRGMATECRGNGDSERSELQLNSPGRALRPQDHRRRGLTYAETSALGIAAEFISGGAITLRPRIRRSATGAGAFDASASASSAHHAAVRAAADGGGGDREIASVTAAV